MLIGIMVGCAAHRSTWPHIQGWLGPRSNWQFWNI